MPAESNRLRIPPVGRCACGFAQPLSVHTRQMLQHSSISCEQNPVLLDGSARWRYERTITTPTKC